MGSELRVQDCKGKGCQQKLVFISRFNPKKQRQTRVPCEAKPYVRHGSDPLPKGIYFDIIGNSCNEQNAPCGVDLYRSHWSDCPDRRDFKTQAKEEVQ